ncbi:transposase [Streptomyces sp. NPDC002346]
MAATQAPPTYLDRLRSDLDLIEGDFLKVLADSQIRNVDPNRRSSGVVHFGAAKWGWVPSGPELEARRMELLGRVRDWEPLFRLLFPHPTPEVTKRLDGSLALLQRWLVRPRDTTVPASIDKAIDKVKAAVATLRKLGELLPDDAWAVRVAVDTNMLLDDPDGRDGRWRITRGTAPNQMVSTVDPEARHVHKTRSHQQDGFKAHLAIEPETGLYTAVALRPGAGAEHHEAAVGLELLADEDQPVVAFGDTAYSTGDARQALHEAGHRLFLKPAPLRPAVPGGFTLDDFTIDTTAATVTCPAGHTVGLSEPGGQHHQRKAVFKDLCPGCPLREQCTKAKAGRILTIRPHHDLQATARHQAATDPDWQADYRRWRPPVERAVAWLVHHGNRKLRYRGTISNNTWLHTRAAALNLRRLINLGLTHTGITWAIVPNTA